MNPICPQTELAGLREDFIAIGRMLSIAPEDLARPASWISGWSPEQHLAHLALANELVCRNVTSLLRGSGALVIEEGEPAPDALAILQAGILPRGSAQAPRMVRPPETIVRAYLEEWLEENRKEFEGFNAKVEEIERAPRRIPHQVLGPLSAAQWVRFAAMHTRHHLEIAREVLAATMKRQNEVSSN